MAIHERDGEWIKSERKKRGITQGQLGDLIGYARESISHWERGTPAPSDEQIMLIENAFQEYDERNGIAEVVEPAEEQSVEIIESSVDIESEPKRIAWRIDTSKLILIAVIVIILLLGIIIAIMPKQESTDSGETIMNEPVRLSKEWFMTDAENEKDRPYIELEFDSDPILAQRGYSEDGGLGWMYTLYFTEINGYDFNVDYLLEYHFIDGYTGNPFEHHADYIAEIWGSTLFVGHDMKVWTGGMPVQDIEAIGYILVGTDSDGERLEFWSYAEFSQEIAE